MEKENDCKWFCSFLDLRVYLFISLTIVDYVAEPIAEFAI